MSSIITAASLNRAGELRRLRAAAEVVHAVVPPTPQYCWPLLSQALGTAVWVKHENHTEVGAFKVRGGLTYLHALRRREPSLRGVIAATRGNHGQSIALAAGRKGMSTTIVVPYGNSVEKNAAMRALGAELIEAGEDFQSSREVAAQLAAERSLHYVPSYHEDLVVGVASYWLEFLEATPLDVLYVPIGMGSGICAAVQVRDALGLSTRIVGVVSAHARCYEHAFASGAVVSAPVSTLLADGLAVRTPDADALEVIRAGVDEIVAVTDDEVAEAIRLYFSTTHNVAEGAAAAALAGALQQRERLAGLRVGLPLTGGNIDRALLAQVLAGQPICA
ncbi:threonine dehydratase [Ralstonia soli]|uniref:Threonine dehydratase n=1 Tax=Ralstonia soli TaxID=2953896 RepID=A0ABT1AIQ6_9RALS|nr:threonine dehydratase [Ralstonia soli]MCO5398275.1 threonine dehydratase [Ralstonia soli]